MTQVSSKEADFIAKTVAMEALGFGPREGKVTVDVAEIIRVAERAAWLAMRAAGCLEHSEKASAALNARLAANAKAREDDYVSPPLKPVKTVKATCRHVGALKPTPCDQ